MKQLTTNPTFNMDFLNSIPTWIYVAVGLVAMLAVILAVQDETPENDPDFLEETGMTDYITCSVPGQKVVYLRPQDYTDHTENSAGPVWEITLKNGNTLYLPMEYTTIIDDSFEQIATI